MPPSNKRNFQFFGARGKQIIVWHVVFAGVAAALESIDADGVAADLPRPSASGRTDVHLWITLMPAASAPGIYCSGLRRPFQRS